MKKNKTIKKIMTGLLTFCMVFSAGCITAFANTTDLTENSKSGTTTVEYNVDSSWTASIPAFITPSADKESVNTEQYNVDLSDLMIADDEKLVTTIEYDGVLTESNGAKIPYTLYDANGKVSTGNEILSADSGNPDVNVSYCFGAALDQTPKYSGTYAGTATFNFKTASNKVYTLEEIENNEHLQAIGETKPEYVVAKYNADFTEVTIFANGEDSDGKMKNGNSDPLKAVSLVKNTVKTVNIENDITLIGSYSFINSSYLENVNIPNSVTLIGWGAFANCDSLKNINIPTGVSIIDGHAFESCNSLANVEFQDGVKEIGQYAFINNTSLESIVIPDSVTKIGNGAFSSCSSLKNITISSNVTELKYHTFVNCETLENITIPSNIIKIDDRAFAYCENLSKIYGTAGSYTQTWAEKNGYTFVAID